MTVLNSRKAELKNRGIWSKYIDIFIDSIPISVIQNFFSISLLIPYYHMVSNERIAHVCHLSSYKNEKQFVDDMDFFCSRYHPISLFDLVDHVKHGKILKNNSFILTFDDGYSQMYSTVAPLLIKKGIPAVFFLNTEFIDNRALCYKNKASIIIVFIINSVNHGDRLKQKLNSFFDGPFYEIKNRILSINYREASVLDEIGSLLGICFNDYLEKNQPYLSRVQIRKMIDMGFYFGAHSKDHPLYSDLSLNDQIDQTIGSMQFMKKEFNLPYSVFAFPHHDRSVTKEYFEMIENSIDLTFGTGGIMTDSVTSNLQRINFENTPKSAKYILARQWIKRQIYRWLHKAEIHRN